MTLPQFESLPLWLNLAILLVNAGVVWFAGSRLATYCKFVSERTRAGQAIVGTVLLGGIVSMPEMTMAATAALKGDAQLAVNTLLGGIAFAVLILAVTDALVGEEPLSSDVVRPVVLLQGALVILLLTVAAAGIVASDVPLFTAGAWTTTIAALYILFLVLIDRYQKSRAWITEDEASVSSSVTEEAPGPPGPSNNSRSLAGIVLLIAFAGSAVLIAGWLAALTADAVAQQTGLGASLTGFLFGGIVTSLPEVSSTLTAVRLKQYEMAFADAFGTNLMSLALLFLIDVLYPGGPILREVGRFSLFAILLGIAVTTVFLSGLIARPKRHLLRMGIDSVLVAGISAVGFALLFVMR